MKSKIMKMENLNFGNRNSIIPTIIQESTTKDVLMLGYMNKSALNKTLKTGWVYFWSRRRKKLWMKGEQSGNKLKVKDVCSDCDNDALLIRVELIGNNVCHSGNKNCFSNKIGENI